MRLQARLTVTRCKLILQCYILPSGGSATEWNNAERLSVRELLPHYSAQWEAGWDPQNRVPPPPDNPAHLLPTSAAPAAAPPRCATTRAARRCWQSTARGWCPSSSACSTQRCASAAAGWAARVRAGPWCGGSGLTAGEDMRVVARRHSAWASVRIALLPGILIHMPPHPRRRPWVGSHRHPQLPGSCRARRAPSPAGALSGPPLRRLHPPRRRQRRCSGGGGGASAGRPRQVCGVESMGGSGHWCFVGLRRRSLPTHALARVCIPAALRCSTRLITCI